MSINVHFKDGPTVTTYSVGPLRPFTRASVIAQSIANTRSNNPPANQIAFFIDQGMTKPFANSDTLQSAGIVSSRVLYARRV